MPGLRGDPGRDGPVGPVGLKGLIGPKGDAGYPGATGEKVSTERVYSVSGCKCYKYNVDDSVKYAVPILHIHYFNNNTAYCIRNSSKAIQDFYCFNFINILGTCTYQPKSA